MPRLCQACEGGDHVNCGCQTWCECECDPEVALIDEIFYREDYEQPLELEEYDD